MPFSLLSLESDSTNKQNREFELGRYPDLCFNVVLRLPIHIICRQWLSLWSEVYSALTVAGLHPNLTGFPT